MKDFDLLTCTNLDSAMNLKRNGKKNTTCQKQLNWRHLHSFHWKKFYLRCLKNTWCENTAFTTGNKTLTVSSEGKASCMQYTDASRWISLSHTAKWQVPCVQVVWQGWFVHRTEDKGHQLLSPHQARLVCRDWQQQTIFFNVSFISSWVKQLHKDFASDPFLPYPPGTFGKVSFHCLIPSFCHL